MIIAATGHRPYKLVIDGRNAYNPEVFARLVDLARTALAKYETTTVISGMALGWDQAIAQASIDLGITFDAYIPFVGQESKWPAASQQEYRRLLSHARHIIICSEGGYAPWKMQVRSERMVDDCDLLLALWDGTPGGTGNCIKYAEKVEPSTDSRYAVIVNLWPSWQRYAALTNPEPNLPF